MTPRLPHLVSIAQCLDSAFLADLFAQATELERRDRNRSILLSMRGRILATLFYEASTRTRLSFEAAMQKLGGSVLTVENARESSSAAKGETIADTIRVISGYADCIAIRHFEQGTAATAAQISEVPVINAGDGIGEHPTQALMDLYTIQRELGRTANLRIALVGDLLNGRTIHSLLPLLAMSPGLHIDLIAPRSLQLPQHYLAALTAAGVDIAELDTLEPALLEADVVYITRIQRERFATAEAYDAVKNSFLLSAELANRLKPEAIILHALPRVNEIAPEVDANLRAAYFRQARNGLYIRMAVLQHLLD